MMMKTQGFSVVMRYVFNLLRHYTCRFGWTYRLYNRMKFRGVGFNSDSILVSRPGALGDVLMCTPALEQLKRKYPHLPIHFYTKSPELVENLPFIDFVHNDPDSYEGIRPLHYEVVIPPKRPIPEIIGDILGVRVRNRQPSINPKLGEDMFSAVSRLQGVKRIVINRCASKWTPNKDWPAHHWHALVERLVEEFQVVDIGTTESDTFDVSSAMYIDLRGKTDLDQLVGVIRSSDLHIGPVSGPVHIAAAYRIPCVVIYGGYEHPRCSSYPDNTNLFSDIECSDCWLRTPCPYGKKCLEMITVEEVFHAVLDQLKKQLTPRGFAKS